MVRRVSNANIDADTSAYMSVGARSAPCRGAAAATVTNAVGGGGGGGVLAG